MCWIYTLMEMNEDSFPRAGECVYRSYRAAYSLNPHRHRSTAAHDQYERHGSMWEWLKDNVTLLQVLVNFTSALVWIAYLQMFAASFRRQTRSSLLVTLAGAHDTTGRCIISNMGSEPAYIVDVLAEFGTDSHQTAVSVVDRLELYERSSTEITGVSAVGPLSSGSYVDIGSFQDLFVRAHQRLDTIHATEEVQSIKLIAIAATSQARYLVAAYRGFNLYRSDETDVVGVVPVEVESKQIRSRRERKKLRILLQEIQHKDAVERGISREIGAPPCRKRI